MFDCLKWWAGKYLSSYLLLSPHFQLASTTTEVLFWLLTTSTLITAIWTVFITITFPDLRNTASITTCKLGFFTFCSRTFNEKRNLHLNTVKQYLLAFPTDQEATQPNQEQNINTKPDLSSKFLQSPYSIMKVKPKAFLHRTRAEFKHHSHSPAKPQQRVSVLFSLSFPLQGRVKLTKMRAHNDFCCLASSITFSKLFKL